MTARIHRFAMFGFMVSAAYVFCMILPRWHQRRFFGAGIPRLDIYSGLNNMYVDLDCTSYVKESLGLDKQSIDATKSDGWRNLKKGLSVASDPLNAICTWFAALNGEHELRYARELACAMKSSIVIPGFNFDVGCDMFTRLFMGAKLMQITLAIAVMCELGAVLCIYIYWHSHPTKALRMSALVLFVAAPMVVTTGLAIMFFMGADLGDILGPIKDQFKDYRMLQEHGDISYGISTMGCIATTLVALTAPMWFLSFFPRHRVERGDAEDEEFLSALMYHDEKASAVPADAGYGAMGTYGMMGGYGQYTDPNAQTGTYGEYQQQQSRQTAMMTGDTSQMAVGGATGYGGSGFADSYNPNPNV